MGEGSADQGEAAPSAEAAVDDWMPEDFLEEAEDPEDAGDAAALTAAGVSEEELAGCVSVLRRLHEARDALDWGGRSLRELRKALALHSQEVFGQLPQKDALDLRERQRLERLRKRERRQRQLEADRKWKENAQLRAARLAQLEALEAASPALPSAMSAIADAPATASDAAAHEGGSKPARTVDGPVRIPDGPARDTTPAGPTAAGGLLRPQDAAREADTTPEAAEEDADSVEYARQQSCYICKARFAKRHHFYSHLCPACAELNFQKRHQRHDLQGRICLVTGARVKIGFEVALKLLRMGARVVATTRFPQDACRRYAAEPDSAEWMDRLQVRGVDFRFLRAVEALCDELLAHEAWLDVLINNACQTVRRPAGYYRHLLEGEAIQAAIAGPAAASAPGQLAGPADVVATVQEGVVAESAAMSQLAVLAEDRMAEEEAALALPEGQRDAHGQQLDVRSTNSWLLRLGEVSTPEAAEVFCINALTPFVLNGRLRPLLERSPHPDRYVVNVSAMEGKFYRYKQPTHPHTNMAKAALNMLTRTSAEDYARESGIYMNSVDTGWINDENPLPMARRIASDHGFQTPIDEVDAAARILDPVLSGMKAVVAATAAGREVPRPGKVRRGGAGRAGGGGGGGSPGADEEEEEGPPWGRFLKDYVATEW